MMLFPVISKDLVRHLLNFVEPCDLLTLIDVDKELKELYPLHVKQKFEEYTNLRINQNDYVNNILDKAHEYGELINKERLEMGKKKKKKKYYFCMDCGNLIRIGISRGENHKKVCVNQFHNCKYCKMPFSCRHTTSTSRYNRNISIPRPIIQGTLFPESLTHDENNCFFKKKERKTSFFDKKVTDRMPTFPLRVFYVNF